MTVGMFPLSLPGLSGQSTPQSAHLMDVLAAPWITRTRFARRVMTIVDADKTPNV